MKKVLLSIALFSVLAFQMIAQWKIETVPNPKTSNGGNVSNPDKILTDQDVVNLNYLLKQSEDSSQVQIAVVLLKSIGTAVPKEFATSLFNLWGVGNKESNNGLLILFVMDQRRVEFEVGYGLEALLTDAVCYQIQQEYMVPKFKDGQYFQGIVDGVIISVETIGGQKDISVTNSISTNEANQETNYTTTTTTTTPTDYATPIRFYVRLTLLGMLIYLILFIITIFQKDYFLRYKTLRIFKLYIWFILFPIPFIGLYYLTKKMMDSWRNTPRISPKTGKLMRKLDENIDDQYLQQGQITEEQVKSIDYDVWISDEPGDILILSYKRWFSSYSSCPKCNYKTYYKEYDRVIRSATYSSSGEGERKYVCRHCKHYKVTRYTIPRKTKSSSSSSSSRSGSFGGSSSFGGGRSGGGGAGSSW